VYERLHIGDQDDCALGLCLAPGEAVVHCVKDPCHKRTVGYKGNLPTTHPQYLAAQYRNDLFLNMIDPPVPLFKQQSFQMFRQFVRDHYNAGDNVLVHCNQGASRAPSLAMLFLAKDLHVISDESYDKARNEFAAMYERFMPAAGIEKYMREHWDEL